MDPDTVIVPDGPLCKQLLDTHAEDMAIEDALSALDKALHLGVIGLDVYLKQASGPHLVSPESSVGHYLWIHIDVIIAFLIGTEIIPETVFCSSIGIKGS